MGLHNHFSNKKAHGYNLNHQPTNMATNGFLSLFLSSLILMFFNSLSGICNVAAMKYDLQEAEALLQWKGSLLQGEALHSWSLPTFNSSPCNWTGITCNGGEKVTEINLSNYSLQGVSFLLCASVVIFFILRGRKTNVENVVQEVQNQDLFSIWNCAGKIIYEDIIEATENFDDKFCIGEGGYGKVYKETLPTGEVIAVKKLHPQEDGEQIDQRSFKKEIQALTEIHHCNIVKLNGFCSHPRCSFLVYEYMERGSLAKVLKNGEVMELDWIKRAKVVQSVAHALSYMHHDFNPPFVHCDLSSNNILLDMRFEACISDFGTGRLLKPDSSNWSMLAGTYGCRSR